ncbi:MAG: mechanosensitive ion channel domain-containing protein [Pseudomonadota bacterium]
MNINQYMDNIVPWLSTYSLKLVAAVLIFVIGRWLAKKLTLLLGALMRKNKVDDTLIGFFDSIAYYTLLIVVLIAAAEQLGINTTSLLTVLGAAGLAVGLALKDSLSNFASGVMLVLFKPFRVGHFVNAGGVSGTVERVTIFNTVLNTPDNQRVIVPNGSITGGVITNVTANDTRRVDLVFGIGYGDDIPKAKKILTDIVAADERVLKDPAPVIAVSELADSSVNFVVRPWVKTGDYWKVYWDLTEKVKMTFDAEGVSIPFPQRDVHIYNETAP